MKKLNYRTTSKRQAKISVWPPPPATEQPHILDAKLQEPWKLGLVSFILSIPVFLFNGIDILISRGYDIKYFGRHIRFDNTSFSGILLVFLILSIILGFCSWHSIFGKLGVILSALIFFTGLCFPPFA